MATPTYIALATTTLGASASSVTFSSIPAGYRDLVLVIGGALSVGDVVYYALNGDETAANYSYVRMYGDGSSTASSAATGVRSIINMYTNRGSHVIQIMDAGASDKHKTVISRSSTADVLVMAFASRWANTNAVTSIKIQPASGLLVSTTTLSLYGIEA